MLRRFLPLACTALLLPSTAAPPSTLRVAAASSLAEAFKLIAERFEAANPGVRLSFDFAASGTLLQRAGNGADLDLLATADEQSMRQAGPLLRDGSWQVFASNALLLVVPAGRDGVDGPGDLVRVKRIGIGQPDSVPAGRYARDALQSFGLWASLQDRLRYAADARQLLDWVVAGEVDAALVYRSDAIAAAGSLRVVSELVGHAPIRYSVALLQRSRQPVLAARFAGFLRGREARAVLRRLGFSVSSG